MNERILSRLLWKDIAAIKPLLLTVAFAIVANNLLLLLLRWTQQSTNVRGYFEWSMALWIVLPNLVALGAPAMLVGSEEESGTLAWQRTLPIQWQHIASCKLWVGIGALVAAWLMASLGFGLLFLSWGQLPLWNASRDLDINAVLASGFFSLSLLMLGFVLIYWFRSPMVAMLSLIPAFFVYLIFVANAADPLVDTASQSIRTSTLVICGGSLLVLWVCQRWLARRRLWLPARTSRLKREIEPASVHLPSFRASFRPSPTSSLLWQQLRQAGPTCAALVAISVFLGAIFCLTLAGVRTQQSVGLLYILTSLSPLMILLSASWLGAVVFYGDNVHQRRGFFADRGISPASIWWTRMAPPALGFVFTWLLVGTMSLSLDAETWREIVGGGFTNVAILAAVMFAFGQLVSQWSERPMLAFLAAPAYTFAALGPLFFLMDRFDSNFAVIALTIPVLLLATWRLTGRWLEGGVRAGYTIRVLGYTAVAVLIPCLWILASHVPGRTQFYSYMTSKQPAASPMNPRGDVPAIELAKTVTSHDVEATP